VRRSLFFSSSSAALQIIRRRCDEDTFNSISEVWPKVAIIPGDEKCCSRFDRGL